MADCPHCQNQGDASGFSSGLLLGLLLGGAGGYLLSTDKGQEILSSLKENGGEKIKEILDNPMIADKLAELESTMKQARATLANAGEGAQAKIHDAASRVAEVTAPAEPKKTFFQKHGISLGK